MRAFLGFVRKETLHICCGTGRRSPILVLFPVVQVLIFGFAIRTDVQDIAIAVVDPTPDVATLELRERIEASDAFHIVAVARSTHELDAPVPARARCPGAVLSEPTSRGRLDRGDSAPVQLITDGSDPNTGGTMQSYATASSSGWYRDAVPGAATACGSSPRPGCGSTPPWRAPTSSCPGLVAFVLTIISALMTAISITREKETGTMEMLLVSPIRPSAIIAGKVIPYIVLGFVSVLLVLWPRGPCSACRSGAAWSCCWRRACSTS